MGYCIFSILICVALLHQHFFFLSGVLFDLGVLERNKNTEEAELEAMSKLIVSNADRKQVKSKNVDERSGTSKILQQSILPTNENHSSDLVSLLNDNCENFVTSPNQKFNVPDFIM